MYQDESIRMSMCQTAEGIATITYGCSREQFIADIKLQAVVVVKLLALARDVNALEADYKKRLPSVGGRPLAQLRDTLADDNDNVRPDIVWAILQADLQPLINTLRQQYSKHNPSDTNSILRPDILRKHV
jgi:uncharacterized protein with HEPN domain